MADFKELAPFCATASTFWRNNTLPDGDRVILVEAMSQDLRVTLRNLTLANALRRIVPAKLVVYTGADKDWLRILWTYFDADVLTKLARAYNAADVFDIHALVDRLISADPPAGFTIAGETFRSADLTTGIDPAAFEDLVHATAARVYQAPRIDAAERSSAKYRHIRDRSEKFSQLYDAMFTRLDPVALITSHVDYNHWGLAVETAQRFDVPVVHVQSTGTFKAYTLFPENRRGDLTYRGELTKQIGEYFDQYVWPHRKELQRAAELTAWRNKGNLGRPSWWRGKGDVSAMEIRTNAERDVLRQHAMDRFGFDRSKPVVAVYNHAVSDALNTNVEIFTDLGAWFEDTALYAERRDDVNWLFVDHPSQDKYDATDFFGKLAAQYSDAAHMGFVQSWDISKNLMWSLVDLGITVRGSISTELPAFGIPCIQAGWSEWSELGFSILADDVDEYWQIVDDSLKGLKAGKALVTDEQIDKARLWMWFYRSATDVPSVFVQQWEMGESDDLFHALRMTMQYVETDDDPAFESVRRMWARKEPFLTRFDLTSLDPGTLEVSTGEPGEHAVTDPAAARNKPRLLTAYDRRVPALGLPGTLDRGNSPSLQVVDGFARGASVPGRFIRSPGLVGLKVTPSGSAAVRVSFTLTMDDMSAKWWEDRVPADVQPRNPAAPRVLLVRAQGRTRTAVVAGRAGKGARQVPVSFDLDPAEVDADGLFALELQDLPRVPAWLAGVVTPHALVGLGLGPVSLEPVLSDGTVDPEDPAITAQPETVPAQTPLYGGLLVADPSRDQPPWRIRAVMTAPPPSRGPASASGQPRSSIPPRPADGPVVPPSQHRLPPPPPRTRVGRWAAGMRSRVAAESRINGTAARARAARATPPAITAGRSSASVSRSAAGVVQPDDVLTELVADLVREGRIRVRSVGLTTGVETSFSVGLDEDVLELTPSSPLTELSLVRVEVVEDELISAPELRRYGVVWHRVPGV
ncbi:MAG: hypothetical protein ACRDP9_28015 [Kribbellaceae bacterium]